MFAVFVAVSLTAPVGVADDKEKPLPEAAQKELKKFEGKWKVEKLVASGNEETPPADAAIEFKGRKLILHMGEEKKELFDVAVLDPTTSPKLLDFKALEDMPPFTKGSVTEAIYKIDGDDLTIALYIGEPKKRPEKFESEKDSMVVVVTLKREKK